MSTLTAPRAAVTEAPPAPGLARLTEVELRKMTDTRSGRWLLALVAVTAVVMMPVMIFAAPPEERTFANMVSAAQLGGALLLPVVGILSVTSEWSQRTALTTFALVPNRHRVLVAKLLAGALLGTAFTVVSLGVAALGRAVAGLLGRTGGGWTIPPQVLAGTVFLAIVGVVSGLAFGALLTNAPLAITLSFVLPVVLTTLTETVRRLREPLGWIDVTRALAPLETTGVTAGEWARAATSLAVWVALPLAAGFYRLARREIT
ncbi:ABC transporter permease [Actinomadura flavalba]|uniref:ABC transporter permease n=1 Tax=Actinomadura flavalba TaxID=1120938 RepID=UPI00036BEBF7|nr:ABC transporter permease [Actinomadura flavalba]